MAKLRLINSKTVFTATLIVVPTLTLLIYLTGLRQHRTLYLNSLISTSITSLVFFAFIATGLYNGWKLKDTLGNFANKFSSGKLPDMSRFNFEGVDLSDGAEFSIPGLIISVLLWIFVAVLGSILLWLLGGFIWATILLVGGLLYWIIFRAYRLIFKNSALCKGNAGKSLFLGLLYTLAYNSWIYGIIFLVSFLNR